MDVIRDVAEAIGLQANPNGEFDVITTVGLTFGGYPVVLINIKNFLLSPVVPRQETLDTILRVFNL